MNLLFIVNPKSGRGEAPALADAFESAVTRAGHRVERTTVGAALAPSSSGHATSTPIEHDLAVVFGGDGTVHTLLPSLAGTQTALYHVPMGTENLFARQFGMSREPEILIGALRHGESVHIDLGNANGRLFAIMCSAGPDAGVVERLAASRRGSIRHTSYLRPIVNELLRPSLGPVSVRVDGRSFLESRRGLLLVANSPMYALGLNPARDAVMTDGLLDVLFLPASGAVTAAAWYCRAALGTPTRARGATFARAREVDVVAERRTPYQLDGDHGGAATSPGEALNIRVHPAKVRVLTTRRA